MLILVLCGQTETNRNPKKKENGKVNEVIKEDGYRRTVYIYKRMTIEDSGEFVFNFYFFGTNSFFCRPFKYSDLNTEKLEGPKI